MKLKFFLFAAMCMFAFNASAQFTGTGYYVVKNANGGYLSVVSNSTDRTNGNFDALKLKGEADKTCAMLIIGTPTEGNGVINVTDIICNGISAKNTIASASNLGTNPKFTITKTGENEYEVTGTNESSTARVKLASTGDGKVGTSGPATKWVIEAYQGLSGDVDGDNDVDTNDLSKLRKFIVGDCNIEDIDAANADSSLDGNWTIKDLNRIKRIILEQD